MVSDEERRDIIEQAKQEFLLILPEVMGNLMMNHAAFAKMNSEFYRDNPEFRDHKDAVIAVLDEIDADDPISTYEEKLKKAVPIIRERIRVLKSLDMTKIDTKPNRHFPDFDKTSNNGAL